MTEIPTGTLPQMLGIASATIKSAGGAGTWVVVRSIIIANVGAAAATVIVGAGSSNADTAAKRIASGLSIAPGSTVELIAPGMLTLTGGATPDLLYALASAASTLTITLGMVEGP